MNISVTNIYRTLGEVVDKPREEMKKKTHPSEFDKVLDETKERLAKDPFRIPSFLEGLK